MNPAVVNKATQMKVVANKVVSLPVHGAVVESENIVSARSLDEFLVPPKNDPQELLKNRFLCKGGGLLLVGQTGTGKSSLAMQLMMSWALGRSAFNIEPAKPLKSLLIQAENDDGDLAYMREGVFKGLDLSPEDRQQACSKIFVAQENEKTGEVFFEETVKPLLSEVKPDLLWIDPVLAFLGAESNSQEAVGAFLRNQLNPVIAEFNCGVVVVHHTNKPQYGNERRGSTDYAYLGSGSAEWANWSRAILTLQKAQGANDVFELRAAKRGNHLGWREADGLTPAHVKFITHYKEPGTICWMDVDPEVVDTVKQGQRTKEDLLKHVPLDRPVSKNALIDTCAKSGVGVNAARSLISECINAGVLYEWQKKRSGTAPEKYLARIAQPLDDKGNKIFTETFTPILTR